MPSETGQRFERHYSCHVTASRGRTQIGILGAYFALHITPCSMPPGGDLSDIPEVLRNCIEPLPTTSAQSASREFHDSLLPFVSESRPNYWRERCSCAETLEPTNRCSAIQVTAICSLASRWYHGAIVNFDGLLLVGAGQSPVANRGIVSNDPKDHLDFLNE